MGQHNLQHDLEEAPFERTGKEGNIIGVGWLRGWGETADYPADGTAGWAPGAIWQNIETNVLYKNIGTAAACDFDAVAMV